ncbi:MAG: alanine--tRNA ligase, partial [Rhodobacteraceae bacterium]
QVVALIKDGLEVDSVAAGESVQIVLNQTPFYAESGGQVGDSGLLKADGVVVQITDTKKVADVFIHIGEVLEGDLKVGLGAELAVDHARRSAIRANHSATHLLHEALRRRLGDHVAQRGSLNADDRLRFDFSHAKALSAEDLRVVESEVNAFIRQNTSVETRIMTPDDARGLGAQALFGEKYGDEVRVVSMGHLEGSGKGNDRATYSLELCGGTHVKQTGDIGMFVTTGESASSGGVRRIEALTGQAAHGYLMAQTAALSEAAAELKSPLSDVPERVKALLDERKSLSNEVAQLRRELALSGGASNGGGTEAKDIGGISFVAQALSGVSGKELPALIDEHKTRLKSGAVLLIADADGKVAVCAGVTEDLTASLSAVDLVRAAVPLLGGAGGGGRPDLARGGGNDINGAEAAIVAAQQILEGAR